MASYRGSVEGALIALQQQTRMALESALDEVAEVNRKQFEKAVARWKNQPRFIKRPAPSPDRMSIKRQVLAQGDEHTLKVFGYVDKGTEPHMIAPKKPGGVLVFNVGYSAKTSPIANANIGTGTATGEKIFTRKPVHHPGSEGREFSGYFALEAQDALQGAIVNALRRVSSRR